MLASIIDRIADKVRWGYLTAFSLLLISYILTFYSSQQVSNQQEWVHHTSDVINTLDDLLTEITSAESSFRGYLVSNDERFLNDYNVGPKRTDSILRSLRGFINDNPTQLKRLDTLQLLIKDKYDFMSSRILSFKKSNYILSDSSKRLSYQGKILMDKLTVVAVKMQKQENDLLLNRSNRVTTLSNFIKVINIASIVIAIVLAFYSITTFNKENKAKQAADKQAEEFRQQLEMRINELNKANTELVELRSIEKFAATGRISRTIAHEVRNPLTNINLATEHLRSEVPPSDETDILFDMITRNSNRINELINDLLVSTKAAQLHFTPVSINEMLDMSLGFAQDRIDLKRIKIIKNYAPDFRPVLADVEKINIAFLNIIVNAVEAIEKEEGIITITTEDKNNRCVVTISDNGKGMDKESLSKLFEPYFTTKEKGNGLGLTNTQNIILSHSANIYAESEPGKGATFTIMFNYA